LLLLFRHECRNRKVEPLSTRAYHVRALSALAVLAWIAWTLGLGRLTLSVGRHARVRRIRQDGVGSTRSPDLCSTWTNAGGIQALCNLACAYALFEHPAIHHPDVLSFDLIDCYGAACHIFRRNDCVSVRSYCERQHSPFANLVHFATARALQDLRAFVLGDHA